ncbi:GGDEF domain-containing protein [Bacillus sp. AK128]
MNYKIVQLDDYKMEQIFNALRWIFLIVAAIFFYYPPIASVLDYNQYSFTILFIIGVFYMSSTQLVLFFHANNKRIFSIVMKAGIVFDYIAANWLLILSGGAESYLFPIFFLIIMHATIYWRIPGAICSFISMLLSYTAIFFFSSPEITPIQVINYLLNIGFLLIIGMLGALIVNRERKQLTQTNEYRSMLNRDYLTGLYNHRHFQEQLRSKKNQITVAMIDIDYFKNVNDTYGHVVGDQVLRDIGQLLEDSVPSNKGLAFRYGGEEFSLIFFTSKLEDVKPYILDIYKKLNEVKFIAENKTFTITLSLGVANKDLRTNNEVDIVKVADELLYEAKNAGKNRAFFSNGDKVFNEENRILVHY